MFRFITIRLAEGAATLLASSLLIFGALFLAPGDPIAILIGNRTVSPETIVALREQYHLDEPFLFRWIAWLGDVLTGNLGQSITYRDAVWNLIEPRLGTTALLLGMSLVVIVVVGVGLGVVSALGGRRLGDVLLGVTSVGVAVPSFVAALLLISLFAVGLGWFPTFGVGDDLGSRIYHLTLPVIALTISSGSYVVRVTRSALREEAQRDHVQTAIGRGLPRARTISHHVVRNALTPIATVVGVTLTSLVVGSIVIEKAFALDGIGMLLTETVLRKDFAVVQAITLLLIAFVVVVALLVDILQVTVDPRMRARVVNR
ncbi:ABC transporter permease [Glaciibacter psychrotolerans]|uniref:Peptide/nickel transport system permease protein n=1 Tax=Glaciibacter psychrotolerans TaxID=670054 RepID=A0A7Z0EG63_9MICO|nr:ABC transporter permease [Leifsonia psychrotolerans]NYJ21071.1 peptide/nickel transport system permease protein [Leifsonia psychrotolerans]